MLHGLYSGAAAVQTYERRQEALAANLANVSTPGYRRRADSLTSMELKGNAVQGQGIQAPRFSFKIDFTPADANYTGNAYHVALENTEKMNGNAFYAVVTNTGEELYARSGRLGKDDAGRLIHASSGYPVVNPNGTPIQLRNDGGTLMIDAQGSVLQDGNNVGQMKTVRFGTLSNMRPVEDGLFKPGKNDRIENAVGRVKVRQGYLEASNTQAIRELVSMVSNYRAYEASQRILKQMDQSAQQLIRIV